jgi:hypothetical protein
MGLSQKAKPDNLKKIEVSYETELVPRLLHNDKAKGAVLARLSALSYPHQESLPDGRQGTWI